MFHLQSIEECQLSEGNGGEEGDLHKHVSGCVKNPDHSEFIPVNTFSVHHLPEGHRDSDLYDLIKATADLTVRVDVKMTSPHRPEFWPGSKNVPYSFYHVRGKTTLRYGSGAVYSIKKFTDGVGVETSRKDNFASEKPSSSKSITCPCENCRLSDKPNSVWWEIAVDTATHVVFDEVEGNRTSCRLFYDEGRSHVAILKSFITVNVNFDKDESTLSYVTCDVTLGNKLQATLVRWYEIWWKVGEKYMNESDDKINFIVSHPHGCTKQVSVGQWMDSYLMRRDRHDLTPIRMTELDYTRNEVNKDYGRTRMTKMTYTTPTCPGSSGAPVYCPGIGKHVHSGCLDAESKLNVSSAGLYSKCYDNVVDLIDFRKF